MSLGQGLAERKVWATPELVANLLPFLDLASIKKLAESHRLTRQILGGAFVWNKLMKRTFLGSGNIDVDPECLPKKDDLHLASVHYGLRLRVVIEGI